MSKSLLEKLFENSGQTNVYNEDKRAEAFQANRNNHLFKGRTEEQAKKISDMIFNDAVYNYLSNWRGERTEEQLNPDEWKVINERHEEMVNLANLVLNEINNI